MKDPAALSMSGILDTYWVAPTGHTAGIVYLQMPTPVRTGEGTEPRLFRLVAAQAARATDEEHLRV